MGACPGLLGKALFRPPLLVTYGRKACVIRPPFDPAWACPFAGASGTPPAETFLSPSTMLIIRGTRAAILHACAGSAWRAGSPVDLIADSHAVLARVIDGAFFLSVVGRWKIK